MTDLEHLIEDAPLIDTHEHLWDEATYTGAGPDVLRDLFDNYVAADLVVAGAPEEAVRRLLDASDPDPAGRFAGVQAAWERCQFTGYGEAVRLVAERVYGMDRITPEGLIGARERNLELRAPGERLRLLREVGKLDHVQIDKMGWLCLPDESGLDFFLYDPNWMSFAMAGFKPEEIHDEVGIEVATLEDLRAAMEAIFGKHGPRAIAVKTQHAYARTLRWRARDDADAAPALEKLLAGTDLELEEALCLGDWGLARGVELAIQHDLPVKIHTGYYAGHSRMPVDFIRPGHLCGLLAAYPEARFVLMHIGYPYSLEMVALAKHYPNTYVDLCWAWSIDPYRSVDLVRGMIHAAPINKLFAFGGDTRWPSAALAYSWQARTWLARALSAEVNEGLLNESQAIEVAEYLMFRNQRACFDVEGVRERLREAVA